MEKAMANTTVGQDGPEGTTEAGGLACVGWQLRKEPQEVEDDEEMAACSKPLDVDRTVCH